MPLLDFFLSENPIVNRMAFLGVLVFLMRQKRRKFRDTATLIGSAYLIACHLSTGIAEITGWGIGWVAFGIGMAGGFSAEEVLELLNGKIKKESYSKKDGVDIHDDTEPGDSLDK